MRPTTTLGRGIRSLALLAALVMVCGSLLGASSCKGKTGDTGPAGSPAIAPTSTALLPGQDLPGVVIDILSVTGGSGSSGNFRVGDAISVTFTLTKNDGTALSPSELDFSQAFVSGPSSNYQRVIAPQRNWHRSARRNSDGSWTFTFSTPIPSVYPAPDNYTGNPLAPVNGELVGQPLRDGTYTVGMEAFKNYSEGTTSFRDAGNATRDFLFGGASTIVHREVVKVENCNQCHVTLQAHGGFRRDPNLCVLCHVSGAEDRNVPTVEGGTPGVLIDFRVMIHKIHDGKHLPSIHGVSTNGSGDRIYNTSSSSATVATGDGATTNFIFTLPALMVQGLRAGGFSMTFTNTVVPATLNVTDDGNGKLIGDIAAGTNTISYSTGAVNVTFATAPESGVSVVATVTSAAKGSYKLVGYMNMVSDFSTVGFPVWPSLSSAMPKDRGYSALAPVEKETNDEIRRGVVSCEKCHGAPTNGGTAPASGALAYDEPSRRACGSCHDDVVWANPYRKNGVQHDAQPNDSSCKNAGCHPAGDVQNAHFHPVNNPTFYDAATPTGVNFKITALTGGTGVNGNFQAGDSPAVTFTVKDTAGTDIPLGDLDSSSSFFLGPTTNRQLVMPYLSASSPAISPFDFAGRFMGITAAFPTSKGSMSKVFGAAKKETLTVEFTSATSFGVDADGTSLGSGTLPAALSTNPANSSLGAIALDPLSAETQTIQVIFSSATDFSVTGSSTVVMGSSSIPASKNASTRFVAAAGGITFTISVGTTSFAAGDTFNLATFKGPLGDPLAFAIVAGRGGASGQFSATAPNPDRFQYDVVAPSTDYTANIPMDIPLEYLGDGTGLAGQTFTAANLPVYRGRQSLFEATLDATTENTNAVAPAFARFVSLPFVTTWPAATKYVVIEPGVGVGTREYVGVSLIDPVNKRLWFSTPLRYSHASGVQVRAVTLTYRQEGAANFYSLDPTAGTLTPNVNPTYFIAGNGFVLSYRTNGRFGYFRHDGDSRQTVCQPALNSTFNDSPALGQDWGHWIGLPYVDGTYTAAIWGFRNFNLAANGELQAYRLTSPSATRDFLFGGSVAEIVPRSLISPTTTCNACHSTLMAHGGSRAGLEICITCHSVAGSEDRPIFVGGLSAPSTPGTTIDFRTMLHKIHKGRDLANASTFEIVGFGEPPRTFGIFPFGEAAFPAMPGRTKHCAKCHGTSASWQQPADRDHPNQSVPTRKWRAVCASCHDSADAAAHIEMNTFAGAESCQACHGLGHAENVSLLHKTR